MPPEIEKAIQALRGYAAAMQRGENPPRDDLVSFVAFIQGFADTYHHGKEEDILFKAMADGGMPTQVGPLGVMLHEHREARGITQTLADFAAKDWPLGEEDQQQVVLAAKNYGNLLMAHIQKEDRVLYPMADPMLPEAVWKDIENAFEAFEADEANAAPGRDFPPRVEKFLATYGSGE